jgi:guanylate kinase
MNNQQGVLFVVSGPSGVGKTTLVNLFLQTYEKQMVVERVVTYTTRALRPGDVHGVDYYFISQDEFVEKIAEGFFLEWSNAYGAYYGTPRTVLDKIALGVSQIVVIDRAGAQSIINVHDKAILILIAVSSMQILSDRLFSRNSESSEQIQRRLFLAKKEIDEEEQNSLYHYTVVNDCLKTALQSLFGLFEKVVK